MDRLIFYNPLSSFTRTRAPTANTFVSSETNMSTETRREIYHTTMEMSEPISTCCRITEDQKPVMATVEIAYEEGHQDGYQEGWENCNRHIHDVVAQETYDDGIRQGRALAHAELSQLREKIRAQQLMIDRRDKEKLNLLAYIEEIQRSQQEQPLKRTTSV